VLKCLWRDYSKAASEAVRAQVLKTIADVSGQLAQVQGVTTQRHAHEVSGPEGGPVQVAATTTLAMLADPVARKLAAQLSERLAGGASPSDGPEDLTGGDAE
jgi:hypothetical protein